MTSKRVLVIAEAGVNHNGDFKLACEMIRVAADAGADFVKFQTFNTAALVSSSAKKAAYQKEAQPEDESQFNMLKKLELSYDQFTQLKQECVKNNIQFLSTAFDLDSIDFLNQLEIPFFKIPSGEITNLPYLRKIASFGVPVILSTGMANLEEIKKAADVLMENGLKKQDLTILHCSTEYPAAYENVNLKAMQTIASELNVRVGYSDHTLGIAIPIAAVAMGAQVIEKHFTLDKNMEGPDHRASLDPQELKQMVASIRHIEKAMGSGVKKPSNIEELNKIPARKSIIAKTNIREGDVFSEKNLTVKRPGNGVSPMNWDLVLGQKAKRNFEADEMIEV